MCSGIRARSNIIHIFKTSHNQAKIIFHSLLLFLCLDLVLYFRSAAAGNRLILALLEFLQELHIGPRPSPDVLPASACQDCVIKICIVRVLLVCILHVEYGAETHAEWYQAWFHKQLKQHSFQLYGFKKRISNYDLIMKGKQQLLLMET